MEAQVYIQYAGGRDYPISVSEGRTPHEALLNFAKERAPGHEWRISEPDSAGRIILSRGDAKHIYYVYATTWRETVRILHPEVNLATEEKYGDWRDQTPHFA